MPYTLAYAHALCCVNDTTIKLVKFEKKKYGLSENIYFPPTTFCNIILQYRKEKVGDCAGRFVCVLFSCFVGTPE